MKLYNTLKREKEVFRPLVDTKVGMYQCGPTVYWNQHIGNLRSVVMADLIRRSLEFRGFSVQLVRNYTDVGHLSGDNEGDADQGVDRMEKAAKREQQDPLAIAEKYIKQYQQDIQALNTLPIAVEPRATHHISEMIEIIQLLLEKNMAYGTDLAIYFDVSKKKDYTKLSGQDITKNITDAGHGEVSDPKKKNPHDFALWFFKAGTHALALQTWPSPFSSPLVRDGEGFPGWHIECSAMSHKYLGTTFDIHMGGIEHIPIHHTNEIAQSESAFDAPMAQLWMHNEHLLVDSKKMSKSEGTSYLLEDVCDRGFDPLDMRYFFLQAHYRSKQNFTWQALEASQKALRKIRTRIAELKNTASLEKGKIIPDLMESFTKAISDDINVPQALGVFHETLKSHYPPQDILKMAYEMDKVLGLNLKDYQSSEATIPKAVEKLLKEREHARAIQDWHRSDVLRDEIEKLGFSVLDTHHQQTVIKKP